MLLENKNAIVYGAGGSVGGGVAEAFAREGATVHLAGRTRAKLEEVAARITAAGGRAEVAVVDALDAKAVDEHLASIEGTVDVSFNLVSRGDRQGIPLVDMTTEDLVRPITNGITANFNTARAAAKRMAGQGHGVILALNSGSAHGSPMMGGTGLADAATDTLVRNLALEVGPRGVRVAGIWAAGIPDTISPAKLAEVGGMRLDDAAFQGILAHLDSLRMTKRSPVLADIAATAVFLASDQARAITGSFVNATGMFPS